MKKLFLIAVILFSGISLNAQTNLDSLFNIWHDQTRADTTRLKALGKIAHDGYLFSNPDSSLYYAQLQYDFAQSKGIKKQMASALNNQANSYWMKSDYPKALNHYKKSLKIAEEIGDKKGISYTLNNIGLIYKNQGDYLNSLNYHQRSLKINEEIGDQLLNANTLNNVGSIYENQGDYPNALNYYQRSLKIYEEIGFQRGISSTLNNIGEIYSNQGDYPNALNYYHRCLKIDEEIGDMRGVAISLGNIGQIYNNQEDFPNSMSRLQESLKILEELGDQREIANILIKIGCNYYNQGDYPNALNYHQRSLKIYEEIGDQSGIARSLYSIGDSFLQQGNPQKAIIRCSKSLLLSQKIGAILYQRDACHCLYDSYKSLGNGNKALEYHELMLALVDSLSAEETAKKLQQIEFAKQVLADSLANVEADRLVKEAHKEEVRQKNRTRNYLIAVGLLALLLALGFYSRWRYIKKSRDIISKEKDRSENLLLNILPTEIAEELKEKGRADAQDFDMVSILFTDFKGFTKASEKLSARDLVTEINTCFEAFDGIIDKYGIEKIKTIGDAYMAAGGLPVPTDDSVKKTVMAALELQDFIQSRKAKLDAEGKPCFEMRVGVHTGPVVAGIVGVKKFQYDIWGDTVNTASRMESSGEVGKVNISETTYELLKDNSYFSFESRGKVDAKGKGEVEMYFVSKA